MADEEKIIFSFGYDPASLSKVRSDTANSLKNFSVTIDQASFGRISKAFEKNVNPQIKFRPDFSNLEGLGAKISKGIGTIDLNFQANLTSLETLSSRIQKGIGPIDIKVTADTSAAKIDLSDTKTKSLTANLKNVTSSFQSASKAKDQFAENVKQKFPVIIESFNQLKNAATQAAAEIRQLKNINVESKATKSNKITSQVSGDATKPGNSEELDEAIKKQRENKKAHDETAESANKNASAHRGAANAISSFSERIGFSTARLAAYLIPAAGLYRLVEVFDAARTSIIKTNSEIVKLSQILGGSSEKAAKVADEIFSIATKYGQSGQELLKVGTILSRIGRGSNNQFAENIKFFAKTKLSVGFGDLTETVDGTKDALNQFNLKAEDTKDVIDSIAAVNKKFGTTSQDFFTGISAGGGAFSESKGKIKEFIALFASIKQITGQPSTAIGNGINTLSFRLQDPEIISFIDKLTNGKSRDANGELKGIYERLIEIGRATKGLDDTSIINIANKIVGIRQGKEFAPLFRDIAKGKDGLSEFAKAFETVNNATGEINRDASIGLKSLDVQLASVGARFEEVFKNLSQNKGVQHLVEEFADLAKGIANVIDVVGPFIPTLIRLAGIKLAFSAVQAVPGIIQGFSRGRDEQRGVVGESIPVRGTRSTIVGFNNLSRGFRSNAGETPTDVQNSIIKEVERKATVVRANKLFNDQSAADIKNSTNTKIGLINNSINSNFTSNDITPKRSFSLPILNAPAKINAFNTTLSSGISGESRESLENSIVSNVIRNQTIKASVNNISDIVGPKDRLKDINGSFVKSNLQSSFGPNATTLPFQIIRAAKEDVNNKIALQKSTFDTQKNVLNLQNSGNVFTDKSNVSGPNSSIIPSQIARIGGGFQVEDTNAKKIKQAQREILSQTDENLRLDTKVNNQLKLARNGGDTVFSIEEPTKRFASNIGGRSSRISRNEENPINREARKFSFDTEDQNNLSHLLEQKSNVQSLTSGIQKKLLTLKQKQVALTESEVLEEQELLNELKKQRATLKAITNAEQKLVEKVTSAKITAQEANDIARGISSTPTRLQNFSQTAQRSLFGNQDKSLRSFSGAFKPNISDILKENELRALDRENFGSKRGLLGGAKAGASRIVSGGGLNIISFLAASVLDQAANSKESDVSSILDEDGNIKSVDSLRGILDSNKRNKISAARLRGASTGGITGGVIGGLAGSTFGVPGELIGQTVGTAIGGTIGSAITGGSAKETIGKENINSIFAAASKANNLKDIGSLLAVQSTDINKIKSNPFDSNGLTDKFGDKVARGIVGAFTGGSGNPFKLKVSATTGNRFSSALDSTEGEAFTQKFASIIFNNAKTSAESGKSLSVGELRIQAVKELAKSFEAEGKTPKQALNEANQRVIATFNALDGTVGVFSNSLKDVGIITKKVAKQAIELSDNLELFVNKLDISNRDISIGTTLSGITRDVTNQIFSLSKGGGNPSFQVSEQIPSISSGRIQSDLEKANLSGGSSRRNVEDIFNKRDNGFLTGSVDGEDIKQTLEDAALIEQVTKNKVKNISKLLSGVNISEINAPDLRKDALNQVRNAFVLLQSQLVTKSGSNKLKTVDEEFNKLIGKNLEAFQGNPDDVVKIILKGFSAFPEITKRATVELNDFNSKLRNASEAVSREYDVRLDVANAQSQTTGFGVKQLQRGNSLGLNDQEIINKFGQLIEANKPNADKLGKSGDFTLGIATLKGAVFQQDLSSGLINPNTKEGATKLQQGFSDLVKVQTDYKVALSGSKDQLQLLDAQFQVLTKVLERQENAAGRIAVTPIGDRVRSQVQGNVVRSFERSALGTNGTLRNVNNENDLLNKLSPDEIRKTALKLAPLAGNQAFINAQSQFLSVNGDLQAENAPLGVTNNAQQKLVNTLSGLGALTKNGKNSDLDQFIKNQELQKANQEVAKSIEQRQLDVLNSINSALIQGFQLQNKVTNDNGTLDSVKKITNFSGGNLPQSAQNVPITQSTPYIELPYNLNNIPVREGQEKFISRNGTRDQQLNQATDISDADNSIDISKHTVSIEKSTEALNVIGGLLEDYVKQLEKIKGSAANIKVDTNFNITGLDFSSKDIAMTGMLTGFINSLISQLNSSNQSEAELKTKLNNALKSIQGDGGK